MRTHWLLMVTVALVVSGCAGLRQFPVLPTDYPKALDDEDKAYRMALDKIYAAPTADKPAPTPDEQKLIRNRLIEERMAVTDAYFEQFQAGLVKENVRLDLGIALVGIGVGAAGAFAAEATSQILSAVSGGLAGAQAAYGKSVFYDKALSALIAQMRANRAVIAVRILESSGQDIFAYPLWMARTDLEAYYFAGSLPGAIVATAADAEAKQRDVEVRLRPITAASLTPAMVEKRATLNTTIDGLTADKAKALVTKIAKAFAEIKPFLDAQYPEDTRTADTTGANAKIVLKRAAVLTVKTEPDAAKWQTALGSL